MKTKHWSSQNWAIKMFDDGILMLAPCSCHNCHLTPGCHHNQSMIIIFHLPRVLYRPSPLLRPSGMMWSWCHHPSLLIMSSGVVTGPGLGTGIINTDQVTSKCHFLIYASCIGQGGKLGMVQHNGNRSAKGKYYVCLLLDNSPQMCHLVTQSTRVTPRHSRASLAIRCTHCW